MAKISVQFSHPTDIFGAALIPVEVSNEAGNIIFREPVPLDENATLSYDFKPGTYLVRGSLPSGEIAASTVDLRTADSVLASLHSHTQSPRETLSWAYYLQRKPVGGSVARSRVESLESSASVTIGALPPLITNFWRHTSQDWTQIPVVHNSSSEGLFKRVYFDSSVAYGDPDARLLIEIESEKQWQYNLGQFWIQVVSGLHSQFVAVPPTENMRIYVLDHHSAGELDAPFRVIVGSGDPAMQALIGFLSSGDFYSARSVGDRWFAVAEKMLQDKLQDAVAAAVAGYFLLAVGEYSRLHDWTRNLADWIGWLPDGPIIRAFHVLSEKEPDLTEVRVRLLQAVERGIPIYTQGLRMLFDGLNMMNIRAGGKDPELRQALQKIRVYAATARWNSPVTSFTAVEPSNPQFPEITTRDYAPAGAAERVPA
jgi:hypothetical protein